MAGIGLLHGYLLEGSGSNLWTRSMAEALVRQGHTLHIVCQERHPERLPFVSEAWVHDEEGARRVHRSDPRSQAISGRCVLHRPELGDTLPVYVWDEYEGFEQVVPMVDLPDAEIESYLQRNVQVVTRVVEEHDLTALHANHTVLMPTVAQRVRERTGVGYAVMPHGSAIEYAVKKDRRFHAHAASALADAGAVFTIGPEIRERLASVFGAQAPPEMVDLNLGVDTTAFTLAEASGRPAQLERLFRRLEAMPRAGPSGIGNDKLPDPGLEERLAQIDFDHDRLILFVGRLIESKGPQHVLAALPGILAAFPEARLLVVGHGPLRAALESGADPERVIFTGYLAHAELKHLFACCDVAVFPSVVAEAGPLVFLEAMASGCFPIGTYFAGMRASIDIAAEVMSPDHAQLMKLRPEPEQIVADIRDHTVGALALGRSYAGPLRELAVQRYDWSGVASRWHQHLSEL
jgi:glycosyltransferase involved in cell wall biosynthesis